jgi:hypothetical protein
MTVETANLLRSVLRTLLVGGLIWSLGVWVVAPIMTVLVGFGGVPGAALNHFLRKRQFKRVDMWIRVGLAICVIGQSLVVLSFAALTIAFTKLLVDQRPDLISWVLWLVAFIVSVAPSELAFNSATEQVEKETQHFAIFFTHLIVFMGFWVLLVVPLVPIAVVLTAVIGFLTITLIGLFAPRLLPRIYHTQINAALRSPALLRTSGQPDYPCPECGSTRGIYSILALPSLWNDNAAASRLVTPTRRDDKNLPVHTVPDIIVRAERTPMSREEFNAIELVPLSPSEKDTERRERRNWPVRAGDFGPCKYCFNGMIYDDSSGSLKLRRVNRDEIMNSKISSPGRLSIRSDDPTAHVAKDWEATITVIGLISLKELRRRTNRN